MSLSSIKSPFLFISALLAGLAVIMGAFGAHALRDLLSADMRAVYQTAVHYHMWHALGLGLVALVQQQLPQSKKLDWAGWLMLAGILLFSGSLYLLAISGLKWLGMITPLGGIAFIVAWILLSMVAYSSCMTHSAE